MERQLLSAAEVSKMTGLPRVTIWSLTRARRLPGIVVVGRLYRYDRRALEEWISAGGETRSKTPAGAA